MMSRFTRALGERMPRRASSPSSAASGRRTLRDAAQEDELDRVGYVVVPALKPQLLRSVREAYKELGPAPDDPGIALNWSFHSSSADYKRAVSDRMHTLVEPVMERLLDDHDAFLTTFIIKWPGPNSAFAPHQDPSLVDERRFRGVTVWIPLDDTGAQNGGDNGMLHIVPGSHRFSDALRLSDVDRWAYAEHEEAVRVQYAVAVPMNAGEALIFDNRVIHYSMPNATQSERVVLSLGMRPREATCVIMRPDESGCARMYGIPDEFYLDVLPAEHHNWTPSDPPIATVKLEVVAPTEAEFARMCVEAPEPTRGVPSNAAGTSWQDPGSFCSFCGSTTGLDVVDRSQRNNAQLVCSICRVTLGASHN